MMFYHSLSFIRRWRLHIANIVIKSAHIGVLKRQNRIPTLRHLTYLLFTLANLEIISQGTKRIGVKKSKSRIHASCAVRGG